MLRINAPFAERPPFFAERSEANIPPFGERSEPKIPYLLSEAKQTSSFW